MKLVLVYVQFRGNYRGNYQLGTAPFNYREKREEVWGLWGARQAMGEGGEGLVWSYLSPLSIKGQQCERAATAG